MQQHTGQHILSQAFLQVLDAPTVSSRLGTEHSTIDVGKLNLTWEDMEPVERLANSVVFEDRPVLVRETRPEEAGDLRAKKALPDGLIRLVDVENFDVVPCGGTHCRRAGEVGLIKITGWEKVRDTTRVEFVCGKLAEADYFWKTRELVEMAKAFTSGIGQVPGLVRELSAASQALRRELARARARLAQYDLAELVARARTAAGVKIVSAVLEGVEPSDLREMAARLAKQPATVVLLGSRGERAHFVFARSGDVSADMRKPLEAALAIVEGKGGGRSEAAEGGGKHPERAQEALEAAATALANLLAQGHI
jgi:alanyl-tRNA synthetase